MLYARPKGTYDILPPGPDRKWLQDSSKWQWLESTFRELCRRHGYHEIRTPIFEQTALFHRAVGDGTDIVTKETYDFETRPDKDGNRDKLTLRPEGTAGALRAFVHARLDLERPVNKLYYIGPNFRYEAPQEGRYHQHTQAGVEALGSDDPAVDAEVIALAHAFYRALGIQRLTIKLNSVGTKESRAVYLEALRAWAKPLLPQMSDDNQRRYQQNALRMLDSKHEQDIRLLDSAPNLADYLDDDSQAHFAALTGYLDALDITYERDPRLVRGFDYYTRTAFEIQSPDIGAQSALGGGGRYNALVEELGGPPTPGVGFGLGLDRILLALEAGQVTPAALPRPAAFLCPLGLEARAACVPLLAQLRAAGVACDMDYTGRRMKVMLEQADSQLARYAVILGENELAEGVATVRDMTTKVQRSVPLTDLAKALEP